MKRIFAWAGFLFLCSGLAASSAWGQSLKSLRNLSTIGHRGVGKGLDFYSLQKEIALGKMLAKQVTSTARVLHDPQIDEYVNRVAQNLVRHSDAHVPFTVYVLQSPQINAEALPGGYFFIDTGLILAASNEAEMAGVMAHEIAHVANRDGTRQMTKAQLINYATLPLWFVGGIGGFAGRTLAGLAIPLSFLKFSRTDERRADFLGVEYMYETGYDPHAFARLFQEIHARSKHHPGLIARAFETHPPTPNRIKMVDREIHEVLPPRRHYILDTSDFEHMKARLAALESEYRMTHAVHGGNRPSLEHPERRPGQQQHRPILKRRPD